jgi:hypothetical protein
VDKVDLFDNETVRHADNARNIAARLHLTSPNWIGSALDEKMIGIVVVALLAASAAGPPPAIMAATLWFTNVAANHGSKS